jgi:hypothetical protein
MSNEKTDKPEKTDAKQAAHLMPVRMVRFIRDIVVPGRGATTAVTAEPEKAPTGKSWRIDFDGRIRHHRITYYPPGKTESEGVVYVPAEQVSSWEPA